MKWILVLLLVLKATSAWAQAAATPVATVAPLLQWNVDQVPWDDWFKNKKTTVTDKTSYVYFSWDAQVFKANFEVKDKKKRLAEAALQLVSRLTPADAKTDLMKVDIIYYLENDNYGEPKSDSIQHVAHLEFSRAKALAFLQKKTVLSDASLKKLFTKFRVF